MKHCTKMPLLKGVYSICTVVYPNLWLIIVFLLLDSFRVPPAEPHAKSFHTFEVFDKLGYDLEHEVEMFCQKHNLDMSHNGPCCDILQHAKHQQHMIRVEKLIGIQNNNGNPPSPHFGICISTYQRPYDLDFLLLHNTSLPSVLAQSYPHWTMILVGDSLTAEQEDKMLKKVNSLNIPPHKIVYRNLDPQYSEKNIFKEREMIPCRADFGDSAWCHSGTGAMNLAFDIADTLPEVTHLIWLSDDDTFFNNHLANLARAFQLGNGKDLNIQFAFTKGYSVSWSWVGFPKTSVTQATLTAPTPCHLFDHAAAWSKSLNLRLRLDIEQSQAVRHMEQCCGQPCVDGVVLPNDADLFERINTLVTKEGSFLSVFIPQIDLIHLSAEDRLLLVDQIRKDNGLI